MAYTRSNKLKLLQGASALILGSVSVTAVAETVATSTTAVTTSTVDALVRADQSRTQNTTATANDANDKSGGGVDMTSSSLEITSSSTTATVIQNTASPTITDSAEAATATTAGIVVEQDNTANALAQTGSETDGTEVKVTADDTTTSSLTISGTLNRATATGNTASTTINESDFVSNGTSAFSAVRQQNTGSANDEEAEGDENISVTATVNDTDIKITSDETTGSALTLSGSTDSAVATANSTAQRMTLDGTKLTLGTGSAALDTSATATEGTTTGVDASGAALLSSSQTNTFTDVSATNTLSSVTMSAGVTNGSSLDLTTNTQDSTATGSTAANVLAVSGTTVGTGVGIVSSQTSDAESTVSAATTGQAGIAAASLGATTASSASLTDNALQSRATGGTVTNTLTATATTITLQAPDLTDAATINAAREGIVSGAYATLNDQLISGDVTATTNSTAAASAGFTVSVTGQVSNGSSINNDRNAMTAQAQGAVAANSITLAVEGTLSQQTPTAENIANAAVIANIQELADNADVLARVDTTADPSVLTSIGGALDDSSVSTSNNKIQAFADGASATNALTASATTLAAAADDTAAESDDNSTPYSSAVETESAFSVVNRQDGGNATVRAELNDPIPLRTAITGNSSNSSVDSTGNMQDAFATSNKATNSLALSATTLTTDGAVVNNQTSDARVVTVVGGTTTIGDGITQTAGAVDANAGVIVDFDGSISSNSVAVTGNIVRGSAISNVGTNTLTASATTLSGSGKDEDGGTSATPSAANRFYTQADFALSNLQALDSNAASVTGVFATYGVNVAPDQAVTNSQIAVSNNIQFGEALGNSATNRLQLTAVGAGVDADDPTSAVNNVQLGEGAAIAATSTMELYANMASSASTIAIDGNSNTALGAVNNASNALSVSGLTVDGTDSAAVLTRSEKDTLGTFALGSYQNASGTLASTALTQAYNLDRTDTEGTATTGLQNGEASVSNNKTTAEASANRVANSVSVAATNSTASAIIGTEQDSATAVTAVASSSNYGVLLAAGTDTAYAANGSSIALDDNTTTALARGNSATNTLSFAVDVATDGYAGIATAGLAAASAGAIVGNDQSNTNSVEATASDASYSEELVKGSTGSLLNSQASIDGNTTSAGAFGNSGTNSLTVAATNSTTTAAINNVQSNTSTITATASTDSYALSLTGAGTDAGYAASGSSLSVDGNTTSALASGNSSTNALTYAVDVAAAGYASVATTATGGATSAGALALNSQSNTNTVAAVASSNTYSETLRAGATGSVLNSDVSVDNNTTSAAAFGNSGTNSLTVAATNGSISAAVNNVQSNTGAVRATASSESYALDLTGSGTGYAANASSLSVEGNTTSALARGNAATNTLTYTVGVSYSGYTTDPAVTVAGAAITGATAGAVILNAQTNTNDVAATASTNSYTVALNAGGTGSALNSQVSLANNTTNALAFGNSATNMLTMDTYRNGIPSSAIATNQINSGIVTATATTVAYTMTPTGFVSGSALRNSGNTTAAQAIGNSSVSTISGGM